LVSAEEFTTYLEENATDFLIFKARKLSSETKNDPIKKAGVIKDLVNSISLIPDAIIRSVYIKECSTIMEMEEQILQVEVNKLRRKTGEKTKYTQSSESPENTASETILEEGITHEQIQVHHEEEEILRMMMNYGNILVMVEGVDEENEKHFHELTLAEHALIEIWTDDLQFEDHIHQLVFDEFVHEMTNERIPMLDFFVRHTNPAVSNFAINNAHINYNLSEKWGKFGVFVSDEKNEAKQALDHFINSLKEKKLSAYIAELKEELKNLPFEESIKKQMEILRLEQSKKQLNLLLGRIITK
jgi:DNA primase